MSNGRNVRGKPFPTQTWCPLRGWLADYAAGYEPQPRHFGVTRAACGLPMGHFRLTQIATPSASTREDGEHGGR